MPSWLILLLNILAKVLPDILSGLVTNPPSALATDEEQALHARKLAWLKEGQELFPVV